MALAIRLFPVSLLLGIWLALTFCQAPRRSRVLADWSDGILVRLFGGALVLIGGGALLAAFVALRDGPFVSNWHPDVLPHEWELAVPFALLGLAALFSPPGPCQAFRFHWANACGMMALSIGLTMFPVSDEIRIFGMPVWFWRDGFWGRPDPEAHTTVLFGLMSWIGWFTLPLWGLLWGLDWLSYFRQTAFVRTAAIPIARPGVLEDAETKRSCPRYPLGTQ
jgi:hypothetical protein